jgi:hypothetical protein
MIHNEKVHTKWKHMRYYYMLVKWRAEQDWATQPRQGQKIGRQTCDQSPFFITWKLWRFVVEGGPNWQERHLPNMKTRVWHVKNSISHNKIMQNSFDIHNIISVFFLGWGGWWCLRGIIFATYWGEKKGRWERYKGVFFSGKNGPKSQHYAGKKFKALFCPTLNFHA